MEIRNKSKFVLGVESLINPVDVSDLLFLQKLKALLPPVLMKKMLLRAAKKTPYIGFVIEPYSLFLFFKLKDIEYAKSLLPDRYELSKTRLFADDEPEYYMGMGNLGTRASTFWGTRQEIYLIAKDKQSGLLSFIFIDIFSNTLIAKPSKGVANPNCKKAVFTTGPKGEVVLEIEENKTNRKFSLQGSIRNGTLRKLDESLWLMGNTSISYSKKHGAGDDKPFAVIFDPAEVDEALDIPLEDVHIRENTLFPGLAEEEISEVICFPYAQHYIADSPGCYTKVKDRADLVDKYNALANSEKFETFSARTIKRQLALGMLISLLLAALLIILF